jgi:hypothetical protein
MCAIIVKAPYLFAGNRSADLSIQIRGRDSKAHSCSKLILKNVVYIETREVVRYSAWRRICTARCKMKSF